MILSNQVTCHNCGESPWSGHRHDFVQCACDLAKDRVAVDGGVDYLRRVAGSDADFTDVSINIADTDSQALIRAFTGDTPDDFGKLCALARYLRDEMDINISKVQT